MNIDNHQPFSRRFLPGLAAIAVCCLMLLGGGCSENEEPAQPAAEPSVRVELDMASLQSKALGDPVYSVNRILLLPFKKIDESGADVASNFAPVYASGKQIDVNSFTAYALIPALSQSSTYRMLVIGYQRTDFNYNPSNPTAVTGTFGIGAATTPVTLANFHVKPVSPVAVPEFFTTVCTAYGPGNALIGQSFKPQNTSTLKGTLQRLVSGVSLSVTGIPGYVKSITLSAQQLVTASTVAPAAAADTAGRPTLWQTVGDAGIKTLGTVVPSGGSVTFEKLLLPTFNARRTRLQLQVAYGSTSETYVVKVPDLTAVSISNYLIFRPNRVIRITGAYSAINLGFLISATVNLDDNAWDGIQNQNN